MSADSPVPAPSRRSFESFRKEAKHWLAALRDAASAEHEGARRRLAAQIPATANPVTLRTVQHALAREAGYDGWASLKHSYEADEATVFKALAHFEEKARALLDAYTLGTPDALERHYALTWHRRAWSTLRSYYQLDLGKRPAGDLDDVAITLDDARYLIAMEHHFRDWDALVAETRTLSASRHTSASPVGVNDGREEHAPPLIRSRDWDDVLDVLEAHPDATLDANGQMTDEILELVSRIPNVRALRLGGSKRVTDAGVRQLGKLPSLEVLDLSDTGVTDDGLAVVRMLPNLESLHLTMTAVTDQGMAHLVGCARLARLELMWTATGNGAIRAMAGHSRFSHLISGNRVDDDGLLLLQALPRFREYDETHADKRADAQTPRAHETLRPTPHQRAELRGVFTDRGLAHMAKLDGLGALSLNGGLDAITARGVRALAGLRSLRELSIDAKSEWMGAIAALPHLRALSIQDTAADDDGWAALGASQSIEAIWGRRAYGLAVRGFEALSRMPRLRNLSTSLRNVPDATLALLLTFPALRELMPMDVPDDGYRHIGACSELESLTLMYCRDSTDIATSHLGNLRKLRTYFNSYTTITDETPRLLSRIESLEKLTFSACHGLTNDGVAQLARLPRLRSLEVSGNQLTADVVKRFPHGVTVRFAP